MSPSILLSERMSCDQRSLQLSLISFKERVTSQQKRIEDLETENRELRARVQANQTTVSHVWTKFRRHTSEEI